MTFDFKITEKGELLFNGVDQSLGVSKEDDLIKQIAINRIKSITKDWFNTNIGANLEGFIGQPNNEETLKEILDAIKQSLVYDEFLTDRDLYFAPAIKKESISIKVFIKKKFEYGPIIIDVEIDIVGGVKIKYDPYS